MSDWKSLILTARKLVRSQQSLVGTQRGAPRQSDLRRAVSTAYYAAFHALSKQCADKMIGASPTAKLQAWRQVYRAVDHGVVKSACENRSAMLQFPQAVQDFAIRFVELQSERHKADYDPTAERLFRDAVISLIDETEAAIKDFSKAPVPEIRAFCAYVLHYRKRRV